MQTAQWCQDRDCGALTSMVRPCWSLVSPPSLLQTLLPFPVRPSAWTWPPNLGPTLSTLIPLSGLGNVLLIRPRSKYFRL